MSPARRSLFSSSSAVLGISLGACTSSAQAGWTFAPAAPAASPSDHAGHSAAPASPEPSAVAVASPAPAPGGDVLGNLEITAVDLGFQPTNFTVDAPGSYEVKLINTGSIMHDVTFAGRHRISRARARRPPATVDVPAGRAHVHLLGPGPRRRRA